MFRKIILCPDGLRYGELARIVRTPKQAESYLEYIYKQGLIAGAYKNNKLWGIYIFKPLYVQHMMISEA